MKQFYYALIYCLLLVCFGPLYLFFVMVLWSYKDAQPEELFEYGACAPYILGQELRSWKNGQ